ncbi:MAG: chromosome partitioning protein ParB, partial [Cohaesibacter sp.]|nr:chromosome partitioning protein ParB [Cohaesibacter sp.]
NSGKVTFHEGYITEKEHKRREKAKENGSTDITPSRPEITKAMQNYLSLHRHSAVKSALLQHPGIALRLAIAQMLAGSSLWNIEADPQKASTEEIAHSLSNSQTENQFEQARKEVRALLGMEKQSSQTLIYRKDDWGKSHNLYQVFSHLLGLDDASINKILTFIVAETLACNSAMIDGLGEMLKINMADHWKPDTAFFDLLRDKETINAMVSEAAGKQTANAHVSATAKVQKKIILDVMSGQRTGQQDWHPRYMNFPMQSYTKRGGIDAIDQYQPVRKHFR